MQSIIIIIIFIIREKFKKLNEDISHNSDLFKKYVISTTKFRLYYMTLNKEEEEKEEIKPGMRRQIEIVNKEYKNIINKLKDKIKVNWYIHILICYSSDANVDDIKDEEIIEKLIEVENKKNHLPVEVNEIKVDLKPNTDTKAECNHQSIKPKVSNDDDKVDNQTTDNKSIPETVVKEDDDKNLPVEFHDPKPDTKPKLENPESAPPKHVKQIFTKSNTKQTQPKVQPKNPTPTQESKIRKPGTIATKTRQTNK